VGAFGDGVGLAGEGGVGELGFEPPTHCFHDPWGFEQSGAVVWVHSQQGFFPPPASKAKFQALQVESAQQAATHSSGVLTAGFGDFIFWHWRPFRSWGKLVLSHARLSPR
jgi:hypothetical protein